MRIYEFSTYTRDPLFRLPAPPAYSALERELYAKPQLRASISAAAPSRSSAVRLALLKRAWELWKAHR